MTKEKGKSYKPLYIFLSILLGIILIVLIGEFLLFNQICRALGVINTRPYILKGERITGGIVDSCSFRFTGETKKLRGNKYAKLLWKTTYDHKPILFKNHEPPFSLPFNIKGIGFKEDLLMRLSFLDKNKIRLGTADKEIGYYKLYPDRDDYAPTLNGDIEGEAWIPTRLSYDIKYVKIELVGRSKLGGEEIYRKK